MSWSQILGLGGLALIAGLGFWLMSGGGKLKLIEKADGDSILGSSGGHPNDGSQGGEG